MQLKRQANSTPRAKALVTKTKEVLSSITRIFNYSDVEVRFRLLSSVVKFGHGPDVPLCPNFIPALFGSPSRLRDYATRSFRRRIRTRARVVLPAASVHPNLHIWQSAQRVNEVDFNGPFVHILLPYRPDCEYSRWRGEGIVLGEG